MKGADRWEKQKGKENENAILCSGPEKKGLGPCDIDKKYLGITKLRVGRGI